MTDVLSRRDRARFLCQVARMLLDGEGSGLRVASGSGARMLSQALRIAGEQDDEVRNAIAEFGREFLDNQKIYSNEYKKDVEMYSKLDSRLQGIRLYYKKINNEMRNEENKRKEYFDDCYGIAESMVKSEIGEENDDVLDTLLKDRKRLVDYVNGHLKDFREAEGFQEFDRLMDKIRQSDIFLNNYSDKLRIGFEKLGDCSRKFKEFTNSLEEKWGVDDFSKAVKRNFGVLSYEVDTDSLCVKSEKEMKESGKRILKIVNGIENHLKGYYDELNSSGKLSRKEELNDLMKTIKSLKNNGKMMTALSVLSFALASNDIYDIIMKFIGI